AERIRPLAKRVIVVANKVDTEQAASEAAHYMRLGFGDPVTVSAIHNRGRHELLERIVESLGPLTGDEEYPDAPVMKLAIVGKRNAGKSTLVNALAGEERVIVSETPGTTRDAVDVTFQKDGRSFVAIDTAGVRKKSSMNDIDFYSHTRAISSIRRADVVLLLIDATVPISEVDLKLARVISDEFKPVVLGINKWDLARDKTDTQTYDEYLGAVMPELKYAPIAVLTAKEGKNVDSMIELALSLHKQSHTRLSTARVNEIRAAIVDQRAPTPKYKSTRIRLYYATQASTSPPTFVFFANKPELITQNYRRYLENRLREQTPFREVPIRLIFRGRGASAPRNAGQDDDATAIHADDDGADGGEE
ncbi:MAG: ribosome biogenesis GTPase Der, partial [Phycisphaerae bacterium]